MILNIKKVKMQYNYIETFCFEDMGRENWIRLSLIIRSKGKAKTIGEDVVTLLFLDNIDNLLPFHIVLLSCIVDDLKEKGYLIVLDVLNEKLKRFIETDVYFRSYWSGKKEDHIESPTIGRLNLWRITDTGKEGYSISVENYFKNLFPGKDLSSLKTSLNELYFNVFDHADAKGNAFSYIYYDENEKKIYIAICDYGKGIAKTIKPVYQLSKDSEALKKSLESGVSSNSKPHNKGFGLDVVISSLSENNTFRMVSNKGLLKLSKNKGSYEYKIFDLDFDFEGTLIYFELSTDGFPDVDELNDFSLDDL